MVGMVSKSHVIDSVCSFVLISLTKPFQQSLIPTTNLRFGHRKDCEKRATYSMIDRWLLNEECHCFLPSGPSSGTFVVRKFHLMFLRLSELHRNATTALPSSEQRTDGTFDLCHLLDEPFVLSTLFPAGEDIFAIRLLQLLQTTVQCFSFISSGGSIAITTLPWKLW